MDHPDVAPNYPDSDPVEKTTSVTPLVYKALVRSHLEYANAVWSPYEKCDILCTRRSSKEGNKIN